MNNGVVGDNIALILLQMRFAKNNKLFSRS